MYGDRERDLLHLWFSSIEDVGAKTRRLLLERFGNIENVYSASKTLLREATQNEGIAERVFASRDKSRLSESYDRLCERGIRLVYPEHPMYPEKLKEIYEPPDLLYVKGILKCKPNLYNRSVGIVGARRADTYGREMAAMFARELSKRGIIIVSGLARGIDGAAHRGAAAAGGYTMAVLGCGINVTYPPEHAELYGKILAEGGAVISEYGLDVKPKPGYFPMRNRIISGLSDGIFVVEAKQRSGSLITADYALEQGRQVYALPGRACDENSEGTNNLIKQGAQCVTCPEDILRDMGMEEAKPEDIKQEAFEADCEGSQADTGIVNPCNVIKNSLAPAEKIVYSCLGLEPVYIDDIIRISGIGITKAISTLYILEEKGVIKQPVKGYYIIAV